MSVRGDRQKGETDKNPGSQFVSSIVKRLLDQMQAKRSGGRLDMLQSLFSLATGRRIISGTDGLRLIALLGPFAPTWNNVIVDDILAVQ